mgnify:CR=1 FL=1
MGRKVILAGVKRVEPSAGVETPMSPRAALSGLDRTQPRLDAGWAASAKAALSGVERARPGLVPAGAASLGTVAPGTERARLQAGTTRTASLVARPGALFSGLVHAGFLAGLVGWAMTAEPPQAAAEHPPAAGRFRG